MTKLRIIVRMQKIPTIYRRNPLKPSELLPEPKPECDWVFRGEGVPTRKVDGTALRYDGTQWWKRYDAKKGRTPPPQFQAADEADEVTGHWPGWLPVTE